MTTVMTLPMALDPVVRLLGDERYTIGDQQLEMAMAAMQAIDIYHGEEDRTKVGFDKANDDSQRQTLSQWSNCPYCSAKTNQVVYTFGPNGILIAGACVRCGTKGRNLAR